MHHVGVLLSLAAQAEHRHGTLWPGPSDGALPRVELSMSKAEVLSPRPAPPRARLPSFSKHRVSQKLPHRPYRLLTLHVTLGEKQPGAAASCGPPNTEREPYPFTFGLWRAGVSDSEMASEARSRLGHGGKAKNMRGRGPSSMRVRGVEDELQLRRARKLRRLLPPPRVVWDCCLSLSRDCQCVDATAMRPPRSSNHERRGGWGLVRLRFATGRISSVVHQMRSEVRGVGGCLFNWQQSPRPSRRSRGPVDPLWPALSDRS